jgi:hypothetical protein
MIAADGKGVETVVVFKVVVVLVTGELVDEAVVKLEMTAA